MLPKAKQLQSIFALDLGTTKFCLACLQVGRPLAPPSVRIVSVPADGMRRGMVANLSHARQALRELIDLAEHQLGTDVTRVVVGVAGSHLSSRMVTCQKPLESEMVTARDIRGLIEAAEAEQQLDGRELLHTVPIGYRIDERELVDDPRGFRGQRAAGDFFLIDADRLYLRDIVDLCNDSGLQVLRLYSEPFASASVTVPDSMREIGVAIADIGGGTSDGIVFRSGRPVAAFTINVAGKLMTSDLSIGLSVDGDTAEGIKLRFGIKPRADDAMEVSDIRGRPKTIDGAAVTTILRARIHELCALTARSLLPYKGSLGAGLLLTGGGSEVKGIAEFFQDKMGIPVSRARPSLRKVEVGSDSSEHPSRHATVIGLLNLELCRMDDQEKIRRQSWTSKYLGHIANWIKELS